MKSNASHNQFKTITRDHARKVLFVDSDDENDDEKKEQVKQSIIKYKEIKNEIKEGMDLSILNSFKKVV